MTEGRSDQIERPKRSKEKDRQRRSVNNLLRYCEWSIPSSPSGRRGTSRGFQLKRINYTFDEDARPEWCYPSQVLMRAPLRALGYTAQPQEGER